MNYNSTTDKLAEALRYCREKIAYMTAHGEWYSPGRAIEKADEALAAYEAEAKPAEAKFIDGDCVISWVSEPKRAPAHWEPTDAEAKPAPADVLTQAVDAAMVEMKNIHPPLRRSECQRLIQAALNAAPAAPAPITDAELDALMGFWPKSNPGFASVSREELRQSMRAAIEASNKGGAA